MSDEAPSTVEPTRRLIACIGAKGGCGTTLVATHLAADIAKVEHEVGLVDLDFSKGDVAGALDLMAPRTLLDLVTDLDRLSPEVIHGTAIRHPSGMFVLTQPTDLSSSIQLGVSEVHRLTAGLKGAYTTCVADCGSRLDEVAAATAMRADLVVLVATPAFAALRDARRAVELLRGISVDPQRIRFVLNCVESRDNIEEIAELLCLPVAARLPRDDETCRRAEWQGDLVFDVAPRSKLSFELAALSDHLTETVAPPAPSRLKSLVHLFGSLR